MTQNELLDLSANVAAMLPHVDSVTIVDGGSQDGTIPYMRNWARQDPRIRYFIHPWRDNFPAQRNNYLARVGEIAAPGDWLLAVDPDEFLSPEAFGALRPLAGIVPAKPERFARVGFQCRSVSLRVALPVWSNVDNHWKGLFFRWAPGIAYAHDGEGAVHERLTGADPMYCTGHHPEFPALLYDHRKQENVVWPRGVRNYFCGGGGPNLGSRNPRWVELKAIAGRLGITSWARMHAYLIGGGIDSGLREWIIRYRHESGWDGASEQREWYKTYFRMYHPEEEPAELRGEAIE
jgi:glycosyltransferase involved in cell wall biosynthesis